MVPRAQLKPMLLLPQLGEGGSAEVAAAVATPNPRSRLNRWIRNWNQASPRHSSLTPTPPAPHDGTPPPAECPAGTPHADRGGGNDDDADGGGDFERGRRRQGATGGLCVDALHIGPLGWKLDGLESASDHAVAQPRLG